MKDDDILKVSIITPTYNREKLLRKAYESLINQSDNSFEWIIVDDGSKDNTKQEVQKFIDENKIDIKYIEKENGGKHTAVNKGVENVTGELILILDSDDILMPDAVKTIINDWVKYKDNEKIAGLVYLRKLINGKEDDKLPFSPYISNHIQCRYNEGHFADRAEVYRTDIMRRFKFPVYGNERFLSEAIVWNKIALEYDTVYIDEYIYESEYQDGGLTASSQSLRIRNPIGAMENYRIMMKKPFSFKLRVKYSILYNTFSNFAKVSFKERIDRENIFLIVVTKIIGDIVYLMWRKK